MASANSEALSAMANVFLLGLLLSSYLLVGAEVDPISKRLCDLVVLGGGVALDEVE